MATSIVALMQADRSYLVRISPQSCVDAACPLRPRHNRGSCAGRNLGFNPISANLLCYDISEPEFFVL